MKKLAIIGASYLQEPLVTKAKEMGLCTLCFAWAEGATCAPICDKFYDISITEKEKILQICKEEQIDGIVTIASDVAAPTVAYVANEMGLPGNAYKVAVRANNKYLMRNSLAENGIPCPGYTMVSGEYVTPDQVKEAVKSLSFPVIVKPSDRSGSLGVTKVSREEELYGAVKKAISVSFKKEAMIEEFIEGREISVEFISYKGKHYPLQITDKTTTGAPHFVELAHHQPADLTPSQFEEIYSLTEKALNALGITDGASHSEYKITDEGKVVVMEIGGRMGGDFIGSDLVQLSTGYDYVRGVIEVALGEFKKPSLSIKKHSGVYFLCKETEEILPVIKDWDKTPLFVRGEISDPDLKNVEKSSDRSGYVIYQADNRLTMH